MKLTEGKGRGRGESGGRQALVESQNLEIFISLHSPDPAGQSQRTRCQAAPARPVSQIQSGHAGKLVSRLWLVRLSARYFSTVQHRSKSTADLGKRQGMGWERGTRRGTKREKEGKSAFPANQIPALAQAYHAQLRLKDDYISI